MTFFFIYDRQFIYYIFVVFSWCIISAVHCFVNYGGTTQ